MRLAIVGAGPAGLAAAHALGDDARATVFEKSRGVSGRAATRWRDVPGPDGPVRWRFDHGAQYLGPDPDSPIADVIRDLLGDDLVEIDGAVWPFDDAGALHPDQARDGGARWTMADGIASLGRRLIDATPRLDLLGQTRVARLDRRGQSWSVVTDDGARHDRFDAVLLTPPAPQTAEIVRASGVGDALADALGHVTYRSQFTVVWGFDHPVRRPADVYALVNRQVGAANAEGGHDVAWLAVESDKPGRAPDGASILLAQLAAPWTDAHYDDDRETLVAAATEAVADVWGTLPDALWTDTQRWRYSLPNDAADADALAEAADFGLFFAGDFTAGKGRVHLAMAEGRAAAERICAMR
ncbi:NAD(P)/FAD-dependent oxidoreductase [Rubrivirga sp.]|uniref:NAD(P)/FAD-dependent oxidoreductase n=1 Tax=Rubrivirga sp. TaxID=1885344 RepID=UPI003B51ACE8